MRTTKGVKCSLKHITHHTRPCLAVTDQADVVESARAPLAEEGIGTFGEPTCSCQCASRNFVPAVKMQASVSVVSLWRRWYRMHIPRCSNEGESRYSALRVHVAPGVMTTARLRQRGPVCHGSNGRHTETWAGVLPLAAGRRDEAAQSFDSSKVTTTGGSRSVRPCV